MLAFPHPLPRLVVGEVGEIRDWPLHVVRGALETFPFLNLIIVSPVFVERF